MKRLNLTICVFGLILSVAGTVVSAQVPTYRLDRILPAARCVSVDISPDKTKLCAEIWYGEWDHGYRIFDTGTYDIIGDWHTSDCPWTGLVSADSKYLWTTMYYGGNVTKVDLSTCQEVKSIHLGSWTAGLAFDSQRRYLYVGENDPGTGAIGSLKVIDTSTEQVVGTVRLNGEPGGRTIVVSPADEFVYLLSRNRGSETLYKIRTGDYAVLGTLPVQGVHDAGISLSSDGSTIYVPNHNTNVVYVIDTATLSIIDTWSIDIDSPYGFFISPDGTHALVRSELDPNIYVFDLLSKQVVQTINVGDLGEYNPWNRRPIWDTIAGKVYVNLPCERGGVAVLSVSRPPAHPVYYVDAVNGNDNNNGLTRRTAFATISKGIDSATNRYKVLVYPGVYQEEINFKGKAITVRGVATKTGIPVIENPGDFAVSFYNGEGPRSILKNFGIKNSFMAIFIAGSSPTLKNLNIIGNKYGVEAYAGSEPDVSNCIFWNNTDSDLFGCEARYSCTSEPGQGNISADPCFVDLNNGDYHLLSQRGRYWPRPDVWVLDKVTSPCIDGGDPYDDVGREPIPNGGRIDMGAFGGTPYASMSEWELKGDINRDGKVNMIDFSIFAEYWLTTSLRAREIDGQLACKNNLSALGKALLLYANDYEDEFPKADQWCDLLLQYKDGYVTKEMFICPSAEGGPGHYAINPNAKGTWSHPYIVLLFETRAGWNQFGGPELLAPENHQGRGCHILFIDGHVEFVESERLDELRWE